MDIHLRSIITDKITRPTKLRTPFRSPVSTDEGKAHLKETRAIQDHTLPFIERTNQYYSKVLSWIKANPSDSLIVDAIKAVYVFKDREPDDTYNLANTEEGHQNLVSKLIDKDIKTLFLIGPRGSGKTFYLNYLMNTEADNLYNNNRMTVYRAEISKLYRYNIVRTANNQAPLSLRDYFYLHITYVTYKYKNRTPLWNEVMTNQQYCLTNTALSILTRPENSTKYKDSIIGNPNLIHNYYDQFMKDIETVRLNSKASKDIIFNIIESKHGLPICHLLAESILKTTYNKNFMPLLVFDGLDNIEYHLYPKLYNKLMAEIIEFCFNNDDLCNPFDSKVIISLRNETFEHLRKLRRDYFHRNHAKFYLKEHNLQNILTVKANAAVTPNCRYFSNIKAENDINFSEGVNSLKENEKAWFKIASTSDYDTKFKDFAERYLSKIVTANRDIIQKSGLPNTLIPEDGSSFLEIMYNWNLRQFIYNFINIFRYVMLFETKSNLTTGKDYLLIEGQLLNGNIYLNSNEGAEFGACIPNIFWFNSESANGVWHGLCLYRILQLLNQKPYRKQHLYKFLTNNFRYSNKIIDERFDIGVTYGLITCEYYENCNAIKYYLTKKGKLFLRFPFLDINQFYYMALDTPLSDHAINSSCMVSYHTNKGRFWRQFIEACTLTSITLVRHILHQHKLEMKKKNTLEKIFKFPNIFPDLLIDGIAGQMKNLEVINKNRYDDLIADMRGAV
ncbi:MAG: hypothetical protein HQK72_08760 [Desulfamplus sp.]|nr:hypothetical protein [Desulfamplus sp.]